MNTFSPLKGKTIIDLSSRLPGPLATKILSARGANVIKIENIHYPDPFLSDGLPKEDRSFLHWYEELNQHKKVLKFDFSNSLDQEEIRKIISGSDALITGLSLKIQKELKITSLELKELKKNQPFAFLEIKSSRNEQGLHDLNALALSGLLKKHCENQTSSQDIISPPFVPLAGVSFAQSLALDLVSALFESSLSNEFIEVQSFLDESILETYSFFTHQTQDKFLHSGLYPCYNIYKTQDDHYVALAAVEMKFWQNALKALNLPMSLDQFKNTDQSVFNELIAAFKTHTLAELIVLNEKHHFCLSPVK